VIEEEQEGGVGVKVEQAKKRGKGGRETCVRAQKGSERERQRQKQRQREGERGKKERWKIES